MDYVCIQPYDYIPGLFQHHNFQITYSQFLLRQTMHSIYSPNSESVFPAALGEDSKVSLSTSSVVSDYTSVPSLHFFINFILNKPSTVGWDTTMCQ